MRHFKENDKGGQALKNNYRYVNSALIDTFAGIVWKAKRNGIKGYLLRKEFTVSNQINGRL